MAEFYTWTLAGRSLVTLLIAICIPAQTLATVLSYYQRPRTKLRLLENLLELSLLFHMIVLSLLAGEGQLSHYSGLIVPTGYVVLRYLAVACVLPPAFAVMAYGKKAWVLPVIAVSFPTLPFMEAACGNAYAWLYISALLFWLVRGTCFSLVRYREIRTSISYLSVKDAVDSLHTGVLFSEQDGAIALVNVQMQRLMIETTGRIHRNARHFCGLLDSGVLSPGCSKTEYEGQIVCLLPDKTAWIFTRTEIQIKNGQYLQLTASDITERWALTAQLKRQEELLILRGEELKKMIGQLQTLSQTREFQNAKLRAHDILGQRLAMMLHSVSSGRELDYDLLRAQLQSLPQDLKSGRSTATPQDRLDSLRQVFETIDVEVSLDGELPQDDVAGFIFMDIISESVVNAVRHGFASRIFVQSKHSDDGWHLTITDNGNGGGHSLPVREGGGIGGMRGKLEPHGGMLAVTNQPRFVLSAFLPGGVANV